MVNKDVAWSHKPYFAKYHFRKPPQFTSLSRRTERSWQLLATMSVCLGCVYLQWRVTASFNPAAPIFSASVMIAEIFAFVGLILFYFDIWSEQDTPVSPPPNCRTDAGLAGSNNINVDIFITTFDEPTVVVQPSIIAAKKVNVPDGIEMKVHVLDDGARDEIEELCRTTNVQYLTRSNNRGYKAGNLRSALLKTQGDFIVICDADTQLEATFLENTLGYFRDSSVSCVQTPHWFYDLPESENRNRHWLSARSKYARSIARIRRLFGLPKRTGGDPFMNSPAFFFDVIQRRRNRNSASFCCGAGSIHRREALMKVALTDHANLLETRLLEVPKDLRKNVRSTLRLAQALPFEFHVSEDIFTSIRHHRLGWKSVYHPRVEAKMLSPRSISAWAMQRMKYAGGTYDIFLNANPLFMRDMPWRIRLHYLSTFWSYLSVLWLPILLFSPAISLMTGWSPVKAYSLVFFQHLLPFLIVHEIAVSLAAKGHDINLGRSMNIGLLPMHMAAGWNVLKGRKPTFVPTPKIPINDTGAYLFVPHILTLIFFALAAANGLKSLFLNEDGFATAFVTTNMLWLLWNTSILLRTVRILFWKDRSRYPSPHSTKGSMP